MRLQRSTGQVRRAMLQTRLCATPPNLSCCPPARRFQIKLDLSVLDASVCASTQFCPVVTCVGGRFRGTFRHGLTQINADPFGFAQDRFFLDGINVITRIFLTANGREWTPIFNHRGRRGRTESFDCAQDRGNRWCVYNAPQVKSGGLCSKRVCALPHRTCPAVLRPDDSKLSLI